MNIKSLSLPLVVLTFLVLAGCSTQTVVTLQNGTQYLTKDTPNAKTTDGFYEFTDIAGKRVRVKAADVATVIKEK
ncbi:YgdI/YgdR family lipoprotein [Pseudomonas fluorescens]|uniref:YgdI/YgdR family lipoprotein n=1 Tax=Pseudomonas fluorescens TaxID=294 RepID=UPI001BE92551|nr:YgdI/YgdR family lipoprotein [Pseudomonas fluorescens]MBT2372879.1 YgdI/YgdR family lipoprotein [Pseudomonas fluorescens]